MIDNLHNFHAPFLYKKKETALTSDLYKNKKEESIVIDSSKVGVARLELAASTSLTWRASQLRYTPIDVVKRSLRSVSQRKCYYIEAFFVLQEVF